MTHMAHGRQSAGLYLPAPTHSRHTPSTTPAKTTHEQTQCIRLPPRCHQSSLPHAAYVAVQLTFLASCRRTTCHVRRGRADPASTASDQTHNLIALRRGDYGNSKNETSSFRAAVEVGGGVRALRPRHVRPAGTRNGGSWHGPDGGAMSERTSVWHSWMVEVCHTPVGTGSRR